MCIFPSNGSTATAPSQLAISLPSSFSCLSLAVYCTMISQPNRVIQWCRHAFLMCHLATVRSTDGSIGAAARGRQATEQHMKAGSCDTKKNERQAHRE
mmetsp:Transcript_12228/g.29288  ORF Transcript_12228/g.29288 Transcript_12228/m.29288 type:complete len:98 (-) Transcript_12228:227-520(-)